MIITLGLFKNVIRSYRQILQYNTAAFFRRESSKIKDLSKEYPGQYRIYSIQTKYLNWFQYKKKRFYFLQI